MRSVVLISCGSKKLKKEAKARDLYISPLFKLNLAYAQILRPSKIFILSAKYGLLKLEKHIKPYNKTLNKMSAESVEKWAEGVLENLRKEVDLSKDEIVFLAGERYRRYLIPSIANCKIPLKGLSIGKQLQYLRRHI